MQKKTPFSSLIAAALLACGTFTGSAHADSGLFISGAANYGWVDDDFGLDDVDFDDGDNLEDELEAVFDDQSVGFNIGAGWRFNNWLAVDAAYWDFGEFKSDEIASAGKTELETTAITVGAMASVPLWILDVYGRAGVAFWDTDADFRELEEDGEDLYFGVGAALNIFGSIDLYLEVIRFDLETDLDTANLGVRFTF